MRTLLVLLLSLAAPGVGAASPGAPDSDGPADRNLRPLALLLAGGDGLPPALADAATALRDSEDAGAARRLLTDLLPALARHRAVAQGAMRRRFQPPGESAAGRPRPPVAGLETLTWSPLAPVADGFVPLTTLWLQTSRETADQEARDGIDGFALDGDGVMLGLDREITSTLSLGIAGGRSSTDVDSGARGSDDGTASDYLAYLSLAAGSHRLDALLSARISDVDRRRIIRLPLATGERTVTLTSRLGTEELLYAAGWRYDLPLGDRWSLQPGLRLSHATVTVDDYVETGGGALGLRVETDDESETLLGASLDLDYLAFAGAWTWAAGVYLSAERALAADDTVTTATFVGTGFGFTARGYDVARTRWLGGFGLTAYHPAGFGTSVSVAHERQDDYRYTATSIGLEWTF